VEFAPFVSGAQERGRLVARAQTSITRDPDILGGRACFQGHAGPGLRRRRVRTCRLRDGPTPRGLSLFDARPGRRRADLPADSSARGTPREGAGVFFDPNPAQQQARHAASARMSFKLRSHWMNSPPTVTSSTRPWRSPPLNRVRQWSRSTRFQPRCDRDRSGWTACARVLLSAWRGRFLALGFTLGFVRFTGRMCRGLKSDSGGWSPAGGPWATVANGHSGPATWRQPAPVAFQGVPSEFGSQSTLRRWPAVARPEFAFEPILAKRVWLASRHSRHLNLQVLGEV